MKTYTKAEILFVSFELSQSIAAGCEAISDYAWETCKLHVKDSTGEVDVIFTDALGCDVTSPDVADGICYDVPQSSNNVYSS